MTAILDLLAVGACLLWWTGENPAWLFQDIRAFHGEPWRLITSALPHVDLWHLAFNLYWLWVFGTLIEERLGHLTTLGLFVFLALASGTVAGAVGEDGVGLSGVGYGLFGLLWVLGRRDERFAGAIDGPTVAVFVGWFFVCILATKAGFLHVGNVAHAAGAAFGVLAGFAIADRARRRLFAGVTVGLVAVAFAVGMLWRPSLDWFGKAGDDYAVLAYLELDANRPGRAIEYYMRSIRAGADRADNWFNLGIAYQQLGQDTDAEAAYARAVRQMPQDRGFRQALADVKEALALASLERDEVTASVRRFREATELDGTDARRWYNLGTAYERGGDGPAALKAYGRAVALAPGDQQYRAALDEVSRRQTRGDDKGRKGQ